MYPTELYAQVGKYALRAHSELPEVAPGIVDYFYEKLQALRIKNQQEGGKELDNNGKGVDKLKYMVEKSQTILMKASAIFPFDLFPDMITIDRQKLTIVHRTFFSQEQTVSVPLSDITNVQADVGPLFGSITVTSEHFMNNTQKINYLSRRDVLELQRVLQGMTMACKEGIDLSTIDEDDLMPLLEELGKGIVKK
jgi:hypothetical protein